jgi:hypothetical protein
MKLRGEVDRVGRSATGWCADSVRSGDAQAACCFRPKADRVLQFASREETCSRIALAGESGPANRRRRSGGWFAAGQDR